jgi:hypothetical protein
MKTTVSMQCVFETKYLGPTNTRSGRVKVLAGGRTCTVPWDSDLGVDANHATAVREFIKRFNMSGSFTDLVGASLFDGRYVFISANGPARVFEHGEEFET